MFYYYVMVIYKMKWEGLIKCGGIDFFFVREYIMVVSWNGCVFICLFVLVSDGELYMVIVFRFMFDNFNVYFWFMKFMCYFFYDINYNWF